MTVCGALKRFLILTQFLNRALQAEVLHFNLNTENSLYAHILHNTPLTIKASSFLPQTDVSHNTWRGSGGILRS